MGRGKVFFLAFMLPFLASSCIDDVNFSSAYEKKVVVECVLNNLDNTQHLFMHYNSKMTDDGFDFLEEGVEARLYIEGEMENAVRFNRISDSEWTASFPITCSIDHTMDNYSFDDYYSRITIPEKTFCLEVSLNGKMLASAKTATESNVFQTQTVWKMATVVSEKQSVIWFVNYEDGSYSRVINADNYDASIPDRGKQVRDFSNLDVFNKVGTNEFFFGTRFEGTYAVGIPNYKIFLPSKEYDDYLKTLIYRELFYDKEDPAKQLNDYKVKTNVKIGTGIFGVCYMFNTMKEWNNYQY
ncbi:MAG: DUF4249 family protein [Bacteroidales bacterium]|nr:DUF4249 family protein [Bacteroidales bacterium]MBQ2091400.1 DUF4249 family protein [Bacteroidales bacterium]MBQ7468425.1 DUF4249 family protein [Bacteroidales bacterium]MBQ8461743.1 DUF4249 family protein [Bacteroidales bacterium]